MVMGFRILRVNCKTINLLYESQCGKRTFMPNANSEGPDQPLHHAGHSGSPTSVHRCIL